MERNVDYNTERTHLVLPEYGRAIQQMVDHALTIEDRSERQCCAQTIVALMKNMQDRNCDQDELVHKLWNHLAVMSSYKLDIDYPVEIVAEEQAKKHPDPLPYPMKKIMRKHYGVLIEQALELAMQMPEGMERDELLRRAANQMKQNLFVWNKDSMDANVIAQDIARYTNGKIQLDLNTFHFAPVGMPAPQNAQMGKKKKKNRL